MFPGFLIGFREALEAALIVGIVIGYLKKTSRTVHIPAVWRAVELAVIASVVRHGFSINSLEGSRGRKKNGLKECLCSPVRPLSPTQSSTSSIISAHGQKWKPKRNQHSPVPAFSGFPSWSFFRSCVKAWKP